MSELKQKNLKLSDDTIDLLRLCAYESRTTESDAVEYGLVSLIGVKILQDLRQANKASDSTDRKEHMVAAAWKTQQLSKYDTENYWRVMFNNHDSHWELQKSSDDKKWDPWPWKGAAQIVEAGGVLLVERAVDEDEEFEIE